MPAANTRRASVNQDDPDVDWGRLSRSIQKLNDNTATTDGEKLATVMICTGLLAKLGKRWEDLAEALDAKRNLDIALEAAEILQARNAQLIAENEHLRATGGAVALWTDVNARPSEVNQVARWALDLHNRGKVQLTPWEVGFVLDCTTWSRPLSQKMRPKFEQVVNLIIRATGELPPTVT